MNETNQIKYGRIEYFEPNEYIEQEDLTKYVNLYVSVPSRYYNNNKREYDSILGGTKIEDKDHKVYRLLTDSYSNITYNNFKNGGEVENCELFGIENIEISFDSQFFPTVTIRFNDVKGHGLMSTMEHNLAMTHYGNEKLMVTSQSFFKSLFNFPYPRFTLEVKGYLGSTRKYNLNLLDFNTEFDSLTGDFKTTVKFIGDMYGLLADIPMSYLLIAPFLGSKKNETNIYWNNNDNIPTFIDFLNKYALISAGMFESENNDIGTVTELIEVKNKIIYLNELKKKLNDLKESAKITEEKAIKNENCVINEYDENNDIVFYVDETSLTEYGDMNRKKDEIKAPYKNIDSKYIKNFTDDIDLVSGTTNNDCWGEIKYQVLIFKNVKSAISKIGTEINDLEEIFDEEYFSSEFNEIIYDTIGFQPSIKNLYLMVIKHLECFMKYYYDKIKNTVNYPIISGNQSFILDINDGSKLAPFTSFYSKIEGKYVYPLETNLLGNIQNLIEDNIVSDIIDSSNLTYNKIEELISQIETFNEENRENDQGLFNAYFFGDYMHGKNDEYYAYGKVFRTMNLSSDERIELIYKIFIHRVKALKSFYPKADLATFIDNEITNLFNTNYFSDDFVREILNFNLPDKFYDDIINDIIDINYGDDSHPFCRFNEGGFMCNIDGIPLEDKSKINSRVLDLNMNVEEEDFKDYDCFMLKNESGCIFAEPQTLVNGVYDYNFLKASKQDTTPYSYGCKREIPFNIDALSYLASSFKVYGQIDAQRDCCEVKTEYKKQVYLDVPYGLTFSAKHILAIGEYILLDNSLGNGNTLLPAYISYQINKWGYTSMGFFSNIEFTTRIENFALTFLALHNMDVEKGSILIDIIAETIKGDSDYSGSNTDLLKDYLKKDFNYYGKFSENEKINLFFNYKQKDVTKNELKESVGSFKNKIEGTTNIKRTKTMELNQNEQAIKNNAKILKNSLYYNIKNLHDKWLCSLNADYFKLQNNIKCLTPTFNNNDNCICDITLFYKLITNILDNNNLSVIEFLSKIGEDNGLLFLIQPYMGEENISKMFKPQKYLPTDESLPTLIYISQCNPSHNVNIDNNEMPDDGFSLTDFTNNGLSTDAMIEFIENEHDYKVEAFGVTYGMQNQNIFTNINVNTLNPITTEHSIANIISISNQVGDGKKTFTSLNSTNLYSVYSNRSYSCSVTMMGCVDIRPLMYFQLNNIPLFRGAFLIYDVKHTITPNDFTTTFTGVRVSKYKIPIETKIIHLDRFFNNSNKKNANNNNNNNNGDNNNDTTDNSESMEVTYKIDENVVFKSLTKDESEWVPYNDSECNTKGCWRSAVRSARKLLKRKNTCVGSYVEANDIGWSGKVVQLLYEKHDHEKFYNDNGDYKLYYEETDNNRVDKYKYCVEYMKNEIGDEKSPAPVIVGVAHSVKRWNSDSGKWLNEGITDHFLCVYAYAEKDDKVFFKYFESGRNGRSDCVNNKNILIYDPNNGNPLFYNEDSKRNKGNKNNRRYDVSQIRIYGKHEDRINKSIKVGPQKAYNQFSGEDFWVKRDKFNVYNLQ